MSQFTSPKRLTRWSRRHRGSTDLVVYITFCLGATGVYWLGTHLFA